jgi:protein phosphatase
MVDDDEIANILGSGDATPEEMCGQLVAAANAAGGEDNITVVIIRAGRS